MAKRGIASNRTAFLLDARTWSSMPLLAMEPSRHAADSE
jgi:hypothetical protein